MKSSSRSFLAVAVGLAWSLPVAAWNLAPDDLARRAAKRQDSALETRVVVGDLRPEVEPDWAGDISVGNPTYDEVEPAMAIAPDGTIFLAVEQHGPQDGWVRVYRSTDGGVSWAWLVSFKSFSGSRNPSIAYAERLSGEDWIYVAYEATAADTTKRVIVIRFDPDDVNTVDIATVATGITETPDIHPRVTTDNRIYDVYYVYVTYAVSGIDNYFVKFARSLDYGVTYSAPVDITGGSENSPHASLPDIAYGTAGLFVAFEKPGWTGSKWQREVWVTRSTNFGTSWNAPAQLTETEDGAWDPSVAAAVGVSTVMVAFTRSDGGQTDIFCAFSTDGGTSYSAPSELPRTFDNEKSVALAVSHSGGRYHAAFWRAYDVEHTSTDAAAPLPWSDATPVNEANWASSTYSRPAIAVDPARPGESEACVAWTDYRGAYYDIYFDRANRIFADGFESGDASAWSAKAFP